jgi:hypothetical protein
MEDYAESGPIPPDFVIGMGTLTFGEPRASSGVQERGGAYFSSPDLRPRFETHNLDEWTLFSSLDDGNRKLTMQIFRDCAC